MPPRPTAAPSLFSEAPTPNPPAAKKTDWINAHCDGGARGNPGPSGYGALIQDDQGNVLAELSEFLGLRTNNYAEYSGLLGCLQYALDHHHPRLRVVSDSELMVKQIQGKYKVNSPDLKPLWHEARSRIAKLEAFEITHALRHKNKDADRLANEAMDRGMHRGPATGSSAPSPIKANPYPTKAEAPPNPYAKADTMLRGFTKDGVVHILGNATLPDGVFVKIIRE
ncbi:ribonuclease HI family protein [Tunturibacter empetritectus]|uniref:Phosphoglycerate mutase n=1 Tax=Tunturiibacter empetritectus TaxID=3069691 RepID=A0A7W8MQZ7_9BACT|nr:ribonuclease HI family protein [Edaphobacter lichenicola]MBB5317291.1 putative phosphoglycerate mutase [Edaphobacter lichenicola]